MAQIAREIAQMVEMLPDADQRLALELMKRLVRAWDPDFTRVTPAEDAAMSRAIRELEAGDYVGHEQIDWDAP